MELSKFNRENLSKKITEGAVLLHGNNTVYRNNDVALILDKIQTFII